MNGFKIQLEDNGQDFTRFTTDSNGVIQEAWPFQTDIWKGGVIPIDQQEIGAACMMHHPPHINFGHLKHKVIKIEEIKPEEEFEEIKT